MIVIVLGMLCVHSCNESNQFVCYDYYQIRNTGDSMAIIYSAKSIWTDDDEQDTTLLHLEKGEYILGDGTLFLSTFTDTAFIHSPEYNALNVKKVISIKKIDSLYYTNIETYKEDDFSKQNVNPFSPIHLKRSDKTWSLLTSETYVYDDKYRVVNIIMNRSSYFPAISNVENEYILRNNDKIISEKNNSTTTIVFIQNQQDKKVRKDSLQLFLTNGEYFCKNNNLILSSKRDTSYICHTMNKKGLPTQIIIDRQNVNSQSHLKYSICLEDIYGEEESSVNFSDLRAIIKTHHVSGIYYMNKSKVFLYDEDYNILGVVYGSLNFHPL